MLSAKVTRIKDDTIPQVDISLGREHDLDTDIVPVNEWLVRGTKPTWQQNAGEGQDLKTYSGLLGELFLDKGLLKMWRHRQMGPRLVVPHSKVESIVREIHKRFGAGHQSISKVLPKPKETYFGPAMTRAVNHFILA